MAAVLHAILGPCGAGKTTYAHAFARREGAVAFILDDWMARLFGADMPEDRAWSLIREKEAAYREVFGASFREVAGIQGVHVPYKTSVQAVTDLNSGPLHYMVIPRWRCPKNRH